MKTVPFVKYSPCGNTTILIKNVPLSPADRARSAAEIIAPGHLAAEQAGYIDTLAPIPRMDMMGGEFCVNATRAFAVDLLRDGRLNPEQNGWHRGRVRVSGLNAVLTVRARACGGARYEAAVLLDLPAPPPVEELAAGISLVRVPGIAHLVIDAAVHPLPTNVLTDTEALFRRHDLWEEDAAGCIWLHRSENGLSITPYVRVKATGTTYAETACGSGTLAAAIVCRIHDGRTDSTLTLMQPGGEALHVSPATATIAGGWGTWIEGPVRLLAEGDVLVESL